MKRRRSPSPLDGGSRGTPSKTTAPVVGEALRNDVTESVRPPCLRRTAMGKSSALPAPSVPACISGSNQVITLDDAEVDEEEHLRAITGPTRSSRHNLMKPQWHRKDVGVLDKGQTGRSMRVQESPKAVVGKDGRRSSDTEEETQQLFCSQGALVPGKTDGPRSSSAAAAACPYETGIGDMDESDSGGHWLTQQQAGEEFCLPIRSLRDAANEGLLKVEKRPNPYGATYAPMRLYRRSELRQLAFQMWGGEAGVEKERERRREQRWQQRQQRMPSVLGESAAIRGGIIEGKEGRPGRSLPDLRTFLRSSSKRKSAGANHRTPPGGSLCSTSAVNRGGREAVGTQSLSSSKDYTATRDFKDEANSRLVEGNNYCLYLHENLCEKTHSSCPQDVWEEI